MNNGIQIFNTVSDTVKSRNNDGIQTTAKALNVFEPNIFQSAIECFHFKAALTEIINYGKD